MTHRQFEELQPYEFFQRWDGYLWRQEQQENKAAYWTHCLALHMVKKPLTIKELLKPLRRQQLNKDKSADEAELRKTFKHRLPGGD